MDDKNDVSGRPENVSHSVTDRVGLKRGVLEARETCVVLTVCTAVAPGEVSEHVLPFALPRGNGRMCKTVLENRLLVFFLLT